MKIHYIKNIFHNFKYKLMEVLEFRKITIEDTYNEYYNDGYAWSRVYEYQLALDVIKKNFGESTEILIHNSSWGFTGVHVLFKEQLDKIYPNTLHTDIIKSELKNTNVYDITNKPPSDWIGNFDVVINISTLEEVSHNHLQIFENLYEQVKNNGLLICTFDLPGLDLDKFESFFGKKIEILNTPLTNHNSMLKNISSSILECGLMVVKKTT